MPEMTVSEAVGQIAYILTGDESHLGKESVRENRHCPHCGVLLAANQERCLRTSCRAKIGRGAVKGKGGLR